MILQTVHLHHWTQLCIVFGYILFRDFIPQDQHRRDAGAALYVELLHNYADFLI